MAGPLDQAWGGGFVGGSVALDFANTLDWRLRADPVETLKTYTDVLRWSLAAGVLDRPAARTLLAWSEAHPQLAERALSRARSVRETIARAMESVARGRSAPAADLLQLGAVCAAAWAERELRGDVSGSARWVWRTPAHPDRPAWEAALAAAELVTTAPPPPVRQCADAACGWLFLDSSRNRSRRWCSMESCGNRNKAREFYRRARGSRQSPRKLSPKTKLRSIPGS